MWYNKKLFKTCVITLVILLCFYYAMLILPYFGRFIGLISNLIFSIIIAVVLYYATRPLRNLLEGKGIPRVVAIIFIFLFLIVSISVLFTFIWPFLSQQFAEFTEMPKEKIAAVETRTMNILQSFNITSINEQQIKEYIIFYIKEIMVYIVQNITGTLSSLAHIASYFIVTPFLLFYFLKEDFTMFNGVLNEFSEHKKKSIEHILFDIDKTLAHYINGQILVSCIVSLLIYLGYSIIGLDYAFVLALLAFVFNLIPFCGPFISTIPALFIGLSISPFMALKVLTVVLTIHLIDLNLISPRIVGYTLNIHPITIILLLVLGFSIGGILGLFIITPLYAVFKSMSGNIVEIRNLFSKNNEEKVS